MYDLDRGDTQREVHQVGVNFRFPGQGQRNTPVADARRIVEITILTDAYALCPHRPTINSNRCPQPSPSIGAPCAPHRRARSHAPSPWPRDSPEARDHCCMAAA